MRVFKFFVFIFILLIMIFIGNKFVVKENTDSSFREEASMGNIMSYDASNIIKYDMNEAKSIATISLSSSWKYLSQFFGIPEDNIRGSVLKRKINVLNYQADIVVFLNDNSIRQITLLIDGYYVELESFKDAILENAKVHNIPAITEIIEKGDGTILVEIVSYNSDRYNLVISNTKESDKMTLTLDIINNYIL